MTSQELVTSRSHISQYHHGDMQSRLQRARDARLPRGWAVSFSCLFIFFSVSFSCLTPVFVWKCNTDVLMTAYRRRLQNFCRRNGTALPSLQTRFDYHTLVMFYKIHTKQAPSYLTSLLPPLSSRSGYTFRKLSYRFPTVSRTSTLNSFLPRAVALWNALPTNVQQASSIYTFKKLLQSHLKI